MDDIRIRYSFASLDEESGRVQETVIDPAAIAKPFLQSYLAWEHLCMKAASEHLARELLGNNQSERISMDIIITDRPQHE
jgi:hypothetical protein